MTAHEAYAVAGLVLLGSAAFFTLRRKRPDSDVLTSEPPIVPGQRFRKRPLVVEAIHASHVMRMREPGQPALPDWVVKAYLDDELEPFENGVVLTTLEGVMTAGADDWIIRGIQGELYPCKAAIFEATYEPVQE